MTNVEEILDIMKDPLIWDEVFNKFLKSDSFEANQKFCMSVMKGQEFYLEVVEDIENCTYEWSIPRKVEIPKDNGGSRLVYMHDMKDRYVLSVLNKIYTRLYDENVSKQVYSYKEGVKTMSAVEALLKDDNLFTKHSLKVDISKYFNSVAEDSLSNIVDELTGTGNCMNTLLRKLLFTNKCTHKGQTINEYMSLIPGCAFSSFLANLTLKDLDDKMSSFEGITYARYSDDMIFFSKDKERLSILDDIVLEELEKYGLKINPSKYVYYNPGEPFEFLGLKVYEDSGGKKCIDIKDSGKVKMKRYIKSQTKYRRNRISLDKKNREVELAKFFYDLNSKLYKTFIYNPSAFGWGFYVFSNVNVIDSLKELDFYLKERARYIYTGKNNKYNLNRISDQELYDLGMKSFVQMYLLFKVDMDLYKTEVRDIERVMVEIDKKEDEEFLEDHEDNDDSEYGYFDYGLDN